MIFVTVSTGHFDPLIATCNRLRNRYEFVGQIGMSRVKPEFEHFSTCTPQKLEGWMNSAELVIAHAGTGMLSSLFRLKKRHVVIPKQMRYGEANDGQVELARKWGDLGIGVLCMDVADLEKSIEACRKTEPRWVERPNMGLTLREQLGWGALSQETQAPLQSTHRAKGA